MSSKMKVLGSERHNTVPILWQLCYCKKCGKRFGVFNDKNSQSTQVFHYYYQHVYDPGCPESEEYYPGDEIEQQVWNFLDEHFVLSDEKKQRILKLALKPKPDDHSGDRERIKARLARLESAYLDGAIELDHYRALKGPLEMELVSIPEAEPTVRLSEDEIMLRIDSVVAMLKQHAQRDTDKINQVLRSMIKQVLIEDGKVVKIVGQDWCAAMFDMD